MPPRPKKTIAVEGSVGREEGRGCGEVSCDAAFAGQEWKRGSVVGLRIVL